GCGRSVRAQPDAVDHGGTGCGREPALPSELCGSWCGVLRGAYRAHRGLGSDGAVVVPQGAKLEGLVVEAKRARWLGRAGKLRFVFTRMDVPGANSEEVSTTLAGARGSGGEQMNDEGEVRAPAPSRAGAALALSLVASAAIHSDADNAWSLDAGSGAHLQIWGPIAAALLPRLQPLALGLGFAGAGETIYTHLLRRGADVAFPAATELEIRVNPKQP